MDFSNQRARLGAIGLHSISICVWGSYPVLVITFGFFEAIWVTACIGRLSMALSSFSLAKILAGNFVFNATTFKLVIISLKKRKTALWPYLGVVVEVIAGLLALRLIDPTIKQSITVFHPFSYAFWLGKSAKNRFSFNNQALIGSILTCFGVAWVILAGASSKVGGGWSLMVGCLLALLVVLAISSKSQEIALVSDVGQALGWQKDGQNLKKEQALAVSISGLRNLVVGLALLPLAILTINQVPDFKFWLGLLIFSFFIGPLATLSGRCATLLSGDLGLSAIDSLSPLVTLGLSLLLGVSIVNNKWLLAIGVCLISFGIFTILLNRHPKT